MFRLYEYKRMYVRCLKQTGEVHAGIAAHLLSGRG
jgi:hypothetical protein